MRDSGTGSGSSHGMGSKNPAVAIGRITAGRSQNASSLPRIWPTHDPQIPAKGRSGLTFAAKLSAHSPVSVVLRVPGRACVEERPGLAACWGQATQVSGTRRQRAGRRAERRTGAGGRMRMPSFF